MVLVLLVAIGRAPAQSGLGAGSAPFGEVVVTTLKRIHALPGATVLLPLIPAGARLDPIHGPPEGWVPEKAPEALIAGRTLEASMYRLDGRLREDPSSDAWLPLPHEWTATASLEAGPRAEGVDVSFWVLAVELPDRPIAREMVVGGHRLSIHWLPPPPKSTDVARMPLLEAPLAARRRLGDLLRREAIDPFRRWRCSIISDRFTSHALWGERPALGRFDDPILEAAGVDMEVRVRSAIEVARRIDPDLAGALLSSLTTVVRTARGDLLPVWYSDESGTMQVFASLLDPDRGVRQKREDVEAWLDRIPDAIAWVVSDAGGSASVGDVATIGVANLTDRQAICSAAPDGASATNAVTLLPHRATTLRTVVPPAPAEMARRVVARVGTGAYPLTVLTATPVAAPPGIELGPLRPDWSMITWLGVGLPRSAPSSAASARLFAEARQPGSDEPRRWRIFVECRTSASSSGAGDDVFRIWCGPRGLADAVITLDESGSSSIDAGHGPEPFEASLDRREDRWTAIVDLPRWAIPESGVVEIGVDRTDGRGARSAWPRPMIPGQEEPGRLRIDLNGWSPLEGE